MAIKIDFEKAYDRLKWSFILRYVTTNELAYPSHQYHHGVCYHGLHQGSLEW